MCPGKSHISKSMNELRRISVVQKEAIAAAISGVNTYDTSNLPILLVLSRNSVSLGLIL